MARTSRKKMPARKAKSAARAIKNTKPAPGRKPIDLYYWPTPNGWKVASCSRSADSLTRRSRSTSAGAINSSPSFWRSPPTIACRRSSITAARAGKPLSVFESGAVLGYLAARPADSIQRTSEPVSRLKSGYSGKWPISVPRQGRRTTSATTRPRNCHTRSIASPTRCIASMVSWIGGWRTANSSPASIPSPTSRASAGCSRAERFGHDLSGFANVRRWLATLLARAAVKRGLSVKVEAAFHVDMKDPQVRAVLFNQRARVVQGTCSSAPRPRVGLADDEHATLHLDGACVR